MKFMHLAACTAVLALWPAVCRAASPVTATSPAAPALTPADEWDAFEKAVRNNRLETYRAKKIMKEMRPMLDRFFAEKGGVAYPKSTWVFPLKYGVRNIEKYYVVRGFEFFSSVRHNDHPASDVFIRDRDQNCLDDRSGRPVAVLSMSCGVVVAKNTEWEPGDALRGGRYLWIYDPVTKGLFYYAHMRDVFANVGDVVRPGTEIGTVGRTGRNAYRKRSRTHLHIMYLSYPENGHPYPKRLYQDLKRARLITH